MKIMILSSYARSLLFFREDMIKAMKKNGHDVIVAAPESYEEWGRRFGEKGVKYTSIKVNRTSKNPVKDIYALISILKVLLKEKPDKIFAYQAKTVIYGSFAAKLVGIKDVFVMMGGLGSVFRSEERRSLTRYILSFEYKIAFLFCKKVFFQNPDDIMLMVQKKILLLNKTVMVNGSGVNLKKFKKVAIPSTVSFLFVGRIIRDKGVMEFIQAAKIVKKNYPQVIIRILGYFDTNPSAIKQEEIQPYIDDGTIEFLGFFDDVRPYIEACSVFVLPSYHEGTSKSVLEAMAMGRPIITTDAPGCRQTVIDGLNGFLVPVKNVKSLAEKMIWMIENDDQIEKMGAKSVEICQEKFDVIKVNEVILKHMNL